MVWSLKRLFRPDPWEEAAHRLYAATLAQSRLPVFYESFAVTDSLDGRFDLLILHVYLLLRRLRGLGEAGKGLSQAVFDLMFVDMDRSLRELGIADTGIGKRIKKMAQAFYGRVKAYDEAFSDASRLTEALVRNLYRGREPEGGAASLMAGHALAQAGALAAQSDEALIRGEVVFLEPGPSAG